MSYVRRKGICYASHVHLSRLYCTNICFSISQTHKGSNKKLEVLRVWLIQRLKETLKNLRNIF